jgi:uncharacterized membrane protein
MRHFSITVDIQAPAERVWAVMSDFERWPEWTPTVTSIRRLGNGPIGPGSRLMIRQPKLPPAMWKLTEIEEGRRFVWVTTSPGVSVVARHWVEAVEGGGSRATLSIEFCGVLGGLVGRMTAKLNQRYLRLEAAGLKKRSEGDASR